jgi:hypothetical protein
MARRPQARPAIYDRSSSFNPSSEAIRWAETGRQVFGKEERTATACSPPVCAHVQNG